MRVLFAVCSLKNANCKPQTANRCLASLYAPPSGRGSAKTGTLGNHMAGTGTGTGTDLSIDVGVWLVPGLPAPGQGHQAVAKMQDQSCDCQRERRRGQLRQRRRWLPALAPVWSGVQHVASRCTLMIRRRGEALEGEGKPVTCANGGGPGCKVLNASAHAEHVIKEGSSA